MTRVELSIHFDRSEGRAAVDALRDLSFIPRLEELHDVIAD